MLYTDYMPLPASQFRNPEIVASRGHNWADKRSYGRIQIALDAAISDLIRVIMVTSDPQTSTMLDAQLYRMTTRFTVVTRALHRRSRTSIDWELHRSTVSALEHMAYALEELEHCEKATSPHTDLTRSAYLALHAYDAKIMALQADARSARSFMTKGPMSGLAHLAGIIRDTPNSPDAISPLARLVPFARSIPHDSLLNQDTPAGRAYLDAYARIRDIARPNIHTNPRATTHHDVSR